MNDYEKMRKMNELAKDLKKHGFADSSIEAIKQATQIYGEDSITHEVKHGLIQSKSDKLSEENIKDGEKMSEIDIDRKFKKLQDNIDILTDKMNEIIKAINDLDSRVNQLTKKQLEKNLYTDASDKETKVYKEEPKKEKYVEENKVKDASEDKSGEHENQRIGHYKSEDVAIDKMFYFGKK